MAVCEGGGERVRCADVGKLKGRKGHSKTDIYSQPPTKYISYIYMCHQINTYITFCAGDIIVSAGLATQWLNRWLRAPGWSGIYLRDCGGPVTSFTWVWETRRCFWSFLYFRCDLR